MRLASQDRHLYSKPHFSYVLVVRAYNLTASHRWSAIQTLLERSKSDTLILLDCCAGAASATFASGQSITETISASSWDAIAPNPGRYSFTSSLIEVLSEWSHRTFSAAMLHAEILARLKHPRPIMINGRRFEARSTPVHFMMTSNHRAPSIEFTRILPEAVMLPSPPIGHVAPRLELPGFQPQEPESQGTDVGMLKEPDEDHPHVMISLALEDDQHLDLNAWEQWLASFPALAKHVKVQGVFKSHSTLLLLSLPVMVWDLLPDDPACSFIAFIRSNNLIASKESRRETAEVSVPAADIFERSTAVTPEELTLTPDIDDDGVSVLSVPTYHEVDIRPQPPPIVPAPNPISCATQAREGMNGPHSITSMPPAMNYCEMETSPLSVNTPGLHRMESFDTRHSPPKGPRLARHVIQRLEDYFQENPRPNTSVTAFFASSLGIETHDVDAWFHSRRQHQKMESNFQTLQLTSPLPVDSPKSGARLILPGDLQQLLDIFPTKQILLVDLRSPPFFEKSHIHEAINLRAPLSFIQNTTLEMIQDTFTDEQSRRTFARWRQARCVVFYDKSVEFSWECPVADAMTDIFRHRGWTGQAFILKGHFHEFSSSFGKYISGNKMTREAKEYLDSLRQQTPTEDDGQKAEERYQDWLQARGEDQSRAPTELIPSKKAERIRAVEEHQKELEAELERCFPALYNKAKTLTPRDSAAPSYNHAWTNPSSEKQKEKEDFTKQIPLVEPLVRGVAKMQEAAAASSASAPSTPLPRYNKTVAPGDGGEKGGDGLSTEEYDDFENDESLRNDPAYRQAGGGGEVGGKVKQGQGGGHFFSRFRIKPSK